jgi:DNA-binding transcriptional MerR regulator
MTEPRRTTGGPGAAAPSAAPRALRPVDLGRALGLSAQMARRYEQWGFLPPAARSPTGRRCYTPRHLHAMLAARAMQAGYGWKAALRVMRLLHAGDVPGALALVEDRHAALARERREAEATLRALQALVRPGGPPAPGRRPPAGRRAPVAPVRIGEASRRAGVRVSAVRFWEAQGLLQPRRDPGSGYRLFDAEQVLRLHLVAVLRQAGYPFDAVRAVLEQLVAGRPSAVLAAVERRREALARASERCSRATAAFWGYVAEGFGKPGPLSGTLPRPDRAPATGGS